MEMRIDNTITEMKKRYDAGIEFIKAEELGCMLNVTRANVYYWAKTFGFKVESGSVYIPEAMDFILQNCEESVMIKKDISMKGKNKKPKITS
jgi:hypothetical protein